jgi:hypothetical protein
MKIIPLTQGQFTMVSDHLYDFLNKWKWYAQWSKETQSYYAVRKEYLGTVNGKQIRRAVLMHRQILGLTPGQRDPVTGTRMTGDHEDHDTLNNQSYNLRLANDCQQQYNKGPMVTNTTGFKGVSRQGKGYRARIDVNGKRTELGTCPTKEEAGARYWAAAQELQGEFACPA